MFLGQLINKLKDEFIFKRLFVLQRKKTCV